MAWYTGHEESRCEASCWRGRPDHPLATKARCKRLTGHAEAHMDENGNRFTGTGESAQLLTRR